MTYDERRVYSDGAGCQHGTEVYRHEPYRHYCMDCGADLDEIMDLVGLQADLEELEKTDAIVKAAATSYANMVARVAGAQPDAELSEHERLTRALDAAQDEIERLLSEIAALRIERDNRDDALRAVLKVHQRDGKASPYCKCGFLYSSCPTVQAVARGGAS